MSTEVSAVPRGGAPGPDARGTPLRLQNVTKEYPGGVHALRGVSVEIPTGDQVAVVGPSGSGKTTMLTVLGTLERPSAGAVQVAGRDVGAASDVELAGLRAHQIGFVFQSFHLQDAMTAVDNVANGMLYTGAPPASAASSRARRWSGSGSATAWATARRSCPAASASAWRSPARSPSGR